jgi:hypothetical protein
VNGWINNRKCRILLDSGASVTVVDKKMIKLWQRKKCFLVGADGSQLKTVGKVDSIVELFGNKRRISTYVLDKMSSEYDMILGVDGLKAFNIILDFDNVEVRVGTGEDNNGQNKNSSSCKTDEICVTEFDMGEADEKQKAELLGLLEEYKDLFGPITPGGAKDVVHHIEVEPGVKPVFRKPYSMPFSKKERVKNEVEKMLSDGIIRPSKSPWSSPVVLVVKKDGTDRFCVDYSGLNSVTKRDQFPLPKIDEMLRQVKGAKYFSSLDLASGYWQIPMNESDVEKTAFTTDEGHYEFVVLPFGLTNAPATFQRYMNNVLAGIKGAKCYIDDILIFTSNWQEHLRILRMVLDALRKANVRLKGKKCHFLKPEMKWVGHIIDSNGIRVDPEKTSAMKKFPAPENKKELRRFLGMTNYYRNFIKDFAIIASPLYELTKKSTQWCWKNEHANAFLKLKEKLCSAPVLVNPDFEKPYRLYMYTDASETGMGAVLCQEQEGEEKVIAYASQHFSPREKKYATIEKEAGAIIWALKKFHVYVYGTEFFILSDHAPLKWLAGKRDATGRIGRWQYRLMEYEGLQGVEHIRGKDNQVADTLSRIPEKEELLALNEYVDVDILREETNKDEVLLKVKDRIKHGWLKPEEELLKPYHLRKDSLQEQNGILKLQDGRVIVPSQLRSRVLDELHLNHPGMTRMKELAKQYCWWPLITSDIERKVGRCDTCQENRQMPPKSDVVAWPKPSYAWERIHVDYAPKFYGKALLIMVDSYSKWIEVGVTRSEYTSAKKTIELLRNSFSRNGYPRIMVSDNGPQFTSKEMKDFCELNGIKQKFVAPYCPSTNGEAERCVQTVKKGIEKIMHGNTNDLQKHLEDFLFTYRYTPHCSTKKSPAEMFFGRRLRNPLSLMVEKKSEPKSSSNFPSPDLIVGDAVRIQLRPWKKKEPWVLGQIQTVRGPRHFLVFVDGEIFHRHRNQIIKTK